MRSLHPFVQEFLHHASLIESEVLLLASTDINAEGQFEQQWLIATGKSLFILDPQFAPSPYFSISFQDIHGFRTSSAIGCGYLQVSIGGIWTEVMRYTNRFAFSFEQLTRKLEEIRIGDHLQADFNPFHGSDKGRCPKCEMSLEFSEQACPRCLDQKFALGQFAKMTKPFWKSVSALVLLLLLGLALDIVWPFLVRILVDLVIPLQTRDLLLTIVTILAGIQIGRSCVRFISSRISLRLVDAMASKITLGLVDKIQNLSLAFHQRQSAGFLLNRVTQDSGAIQNFFLEFTSGLIPQLLLSVLSLVMMLVLIPSLGLLAFIPVPVVIAAGFFYRKSICLDQERKSDQSVDSEGVLIGIFSGISAVKAFSQEESELEHLNKRAELLRRSRNLLNAKVSFFYPVCTIALQAFGWAIWYLGGLQLLDQKISSGTWISFLIYLSLFYNPLGSLPNLLMRYQKFSSQIRRIFEILEIPQSLKDREKTVSLATIKGEIEFLNVTFGYEPGRPFFRNVSFKIHAGETVGIVGSSGSGKTTLAHLMVRFFDVDSGEIRLDGINIKHLASDELHRHVGIVPQEPILFSGTFAENIAYGRKAAFPELILEASRAATAHDFIMNQQLCYDSGVDPAGRNIPLAEKQKINLARAILRESTLLILDDATRAIDLDSEHAIHMALSNSMQPRTKLIITQRLSSLKWCERIFFIDGGKITESGTHEELMQLHGSYANWVCLQQGHSGDSALQLDLAGTDEIRTQWLLPETSTLLRSANHELQIKKKGQETDREVLVSRCFPLQQLENFLSLHCVDEKEKRHEAGVIRALSEWPVDSQNLIQEALRRRYLYYQIEKIHGIRIYSGLLIFQCKTQLGEQEFVLKKDPQSVRNYGSNGKLMIDIKRNIFLIGDVDSLTPQERSDFEHSIAIK